MDSFIPIQRCWGFYQTYIYVSLELLVVVCWCFICHLTCRTSSQHCEKVIHLIRGAWWICVQHRMLLKSTYSWKKTHISINVMEHTKEMKFNHLKIKTAHFKTAITIRIIMVIWWLKTDRLCWLCLCLHGPGHGWVWLLRWLWSSRIPWPWLPRTRTSLALCPG